MVAGGRSTIGKDNSMTFPRTSAVRLVLVSMLAIGGAIASASPVQAAALPELTAMVLHLPRVDFNYQLVAGDSFRVTFTIDRPAPAGGTRIEMRHFRDDGP